MENIKTDDNGTLTDLFKSMEVITKNSDWSFNLSEAEKLLLQDELKKYKISKSGLSEEEYKRIVDIWGKYSDLDNFYDKEAPQIREKERMGIIIDNVPFDVSLTKEEAVMKYCGCDMKTAQKAFDLVKKVNTAAEFHTGKIREAYTGNLFEQLGRENERPIFDERVRKMQETIITSSSDIEERLGDFAKKIGIYYDSIHEIGPNQTEANADGKKQGSK